MKVVFAKSFNLSGKEFKKGEIGEVPISAFRKLNLKRLVKPYLPDVPEEEIPSLKVKFEKVFSEYFERLKQIPITISEIKQLYPERYEKLRELETRMDEAWIIFDYESFIEALKEIEEVISACFISEEVTNEQKKIAPIHRKLNRACVNCGSKQWLILKPESKISIIKCLNCNHLELHISGKNEFSYSNEACNIL